MVGEKLDGLGRTDGRDREAAAGETLRVCLCVRACVRTKEKVMQKGSFGAVAVTRFDVPARLEVPTLSSALAWALVCRRFGCLRLGQTALVWMAWADWEDYAGMVR